MQVLDHIKVRSHGVECWVWVVVGHVLVDMLHALLEVVWTVRSPLSQKPVVIAKPAHELGGYLVMEMLSMVLDPAGFVVATEGLAAT